MRAEKWEEKACFILSFIPFIPEDLNSSKTGDLNLTFHLLQEGQAKAPTRFSLPSESVSEIRVCMSESPLCSSSDSKDWKTSPFLEIPCQLQQPQAGELRQK